MTADLTGQHGESGCATRVSQPLAGWTGHETADRQTNYTGVKESRLNKASRWIPESLGRALRCRRRDESKPVANRRSIALYQRCRLASVTPGAAQGLKAHTS